ncbi:MAG: LPXTG cell wall anchor domain-containing protein, partial [Limosilactobacillus sp.]
TILTDVTINYTANKQTQVINYVDDSGKIVKTDTVTGKTGQTVAVKVNVPDHYVLVPGQAVPGSVTLTAVNPTINIVVAPKMDEVTDQTQLTKTISRKITVDLPNKTPQIIIQTATFTRTGQHNEVTGQTTYSGWKLVNNGLVAYDVPTVSGYTPKISGNSSWTSKVNGIAAPTVDTKLNDVTIDYTPLEQTGKISYRDEAGHEISSTLVSAKTGDAVRIVPAAPAGWQLVAGQDIPEKVVATAKGIPTVVIEVAHATITVKPGEEAPHGPVPGDSSKTYAKLASLTAQPTRTIVVTKPDGSQQTITQTVKFTRTATFDEVTGEVAYGSWQAVAGQDTWAAYLPETVPGYTAEQTIAAQPVTGDTAGVNVTVSYRADPQSVTIRFVDDDNGAQTVAATVKTGKTGEVAGLNLKVPGHYRLAAGQTLPASYSFTAAKEQTITIHLVAKQVLIDPADPRTSPDPQDPDWFKDHHLVKKIVRTIIDKLPAGTKSSTQQALLYRTAVYNEATGQLAALHDWQPAGWAGYQVTIPAGYTAKIERLVAEEATVIDAITPEAVTAATPSQVIMITYAPESRPAEPIKPTVPVVPITPLTPPRPSIPTNSTSSAAAIPAASVTPRLDLSAARTTGQSVTPRYTSGMAGTGRVSNEESVSSPMAPQADGSRHQPAHQLPQTGNDENKAATAWGLACTSLASLLGLAGIKRKKTNK